MEDIINVNFKGLASVVTNLVDDARHMRDLKDEAREKAEVSSLRKWVGPFAEGLPGIERALAYYGAARFIEAEILDERETARPSEPYLTVLVELKVRLARESDRARGVQAPGFWSWLGATGVSFALDDGRRDDLDKILAERHFMSSLTDTLASAVDRVAATVRVASAAQQTLLERQVLLLEENNVLLRKMVERSKKDVKVIAPDAKPAEPAAPEAAPAPKN